MGSGILTIIVTITKMCLLLNTLTV